MQKLDYILLLQYWSDSGLDYCEVFADIVLNFGHISIIVWSDIGNILILVKVKLWKTVSNVNIFSNYALVSYWLLVYWLVFWSDMAFMFGQVIVQAWSDIGEDST